MVANTATAALFTATAAETTATAPFCCFLCGCAAFRNIDGGAQHHAAATPAAVAATTSATATTVGIAASTTASPTATVTAAATATAAATTVAVAAILRVLLHCLLQLPLLLFTLHQYCSPCTLSPIHAPPPVLFALDASFPLDGSSFIFEFDSCPLCYGTERDAVLDGGEVGVEFCEMCVGME